LRWKFFFVRSACVCAFLVLLCCKGRRNAIGSCYAQLETAKITKNGFVTHRFARLFAEFVCYARDFFPTRQGPVAALCRPTSRHLLVAQAQHEQFMLHTTRKLKNHQKWMLHRVLHVFCVTHKVFFTRGGVRNSVVLA